MKITVVCEHCGSRFSAKEEFAGRTGTCPKCRQPIQVPEAEPPPLEAEESSCPKCGAELKADQAFCEECGERLIEGAVRKTARRKKSKYAIRHEKATRKNLLIARIVILLVAAGSLLVALLFHLDLNEQAGTEPFPPILSAVIVAQYALGAIYVGLFFLAGHKPFGATLTALILYLTVMLFSAILDPFTLLQGWFFKVLIILGLIAGVRSGLTLRRFKAEGRI